MPYSFYDGSIASAKCALNGLSELVKKAEQHPEASSLFGARLYDDMKQFSSQIHLATQTTARILARLEGHSPPTLQDDITSYEDMHERLQAAQEALAGLDEKTVNERADVSEPTELTPQMTVDMPCSAYIMGAQMPNLFFHLSIAYAILRKEGVSLSKLDYIMPFMNPELAKYKA